MERDNTHSVTIKQLHFIKKSTMIIIIIIITTIVYNDQLIESSLSLSLSRLPPTETTIPYSHLYHYNQKYYISSKYRKQTLCMHLE